MIEQQWYAILPSRLVKHGQIIGVRRLNLDLALFRDQQGMLGCVVDQCTHRGAALSLGKIRGDCLQCPFHGLRFDTSGHCKLIPANGVASTQDLSRYNVRAYPVREQHGIIYFWHGTGEPTDQLPFFDSEIDASYACSEFADPWPTHYSRCIENQLDVVHLPFVHATTIGRGNKTIVNGPKVVWQDQVLTTSANNETDHGQKPKPAQESTIRDTHLSFIFPNIWMNHISDKIKVIIYFAPVDDEHTILYLRFYNRLTPFRLVNRLIAQVGRYGNQIIERQDKRVVVTQRPKASSLRSGEKLIPGDGPVIQYRKIRDALQQAARQPKQE